ncbi:MAG: hypothetical protein GC193_01280 [Cryomorphaceae bacterium]|nr:hypothetical protein [Cryomorphaceae bacterium]
MRTVIIIILVLNTVGVFAQDNWSVGDRQLFKDASEFFDQGDLALAIAPLKDLHKKDSTSAKLNFELGVCLLQLENKKADAFRLLSYAEKKGHAPASLMKGLALHRMYRFEEAIDAYENYMASGDKYYDVATAEYYIQCSTRAIEALSHPVDVAIYNLGPNINTEAKEYVPIITPDNTNLYFTSRRANSTARLRDPNGEYFEDVYHSVNDSGIWSVAKNIGQPVNSETHDATVSISSDGKTMIMYRTNSNLTGGDLYITSLKGSSWSKPEKLSSRINSNYQEASAALSPDKQTLYFSSNRPGGFGGKDIYRVKRLPNGEWSLPRNLGPTINTSFDEDAPFIDTDGASMYFASKGHSTIGGYDLFRSVCREGEVWSAPENLGYPANTVDDDIFLAVNKGGKRGYFSSERPGGFGAQDIYSIDFIYRQNEIMIIHGEVRTASDVALAAEITLIDEDTHKVQGVYRSNPNNGKFILDIHPMTRYKVLIEAKGYKTAVDTFEFTFPTTIDESEVILTPYMLRNE